MRTRNTLFLSAMALALLSGCSGKEGVSQAESNFDYLDSPQTMPLKQDPDAKIATSSVYVVPEKKVHGNLGKQVDIRPPVQILKLISGTRTQYHDDHVVVWVASEKQLNDVWSYILQGMKEDNVTLREKTDSVIESDWVNLLAGIEDTEKRLVRYRVEKIEGAPQKGLNITLIEWKDAPKNMFSVDPEKGRRYTTIASNQFLTYYDLAKTREAQRKAQEIMRSIPMQMGVDTSALPIVIARLPFEVFWERVPSLLEYLGMTIEDKLRSQGLIEVAYLPLSSSEWEELGIAPWLLKRSNYQLHIGDLKNRTSISVTDANGKPVSEESLRSFMLGLKAATDYDNTQQKLKPKQNTRQKPKPRSK